MNNDENDGRWLAPRGQEPEHQPGTALEEARVWRSQAPVAHEGYYGAGGYPVVEEDELSFRHYLDFFLRRKWTIAAAVILCVSTALIYSLAATPTFRSRTVLQIQPNGPNIVEFGNLQQSTNQVQAYKDFFQTQYSVLSSRALASRTIEVLELHEEPNFNPALREKGLVASAKSWVKGLLPGEKKEIDPEILAQREHQNLVDALLRTVEVRPREDSYLVELAVVARNPVLAEQIVSTMADQYVELTMDQSIGSASNAKDFIEQQLAVTKARLEQSEVELQEFARGKDIYAIDQEQLALQGRLADLNSRVTQAEAARIQAESVAKQARGPMRASLTGVIDNPLLKTLKDQLSEAQAELAQLRQTFSDQFPAVRKMIGKVASLRSQVAETEQNLLRGLQANFEAAAAQEADLRKTLEDHEAKFAEFETKGVTFKMMQRDINTNRELYDSLLSRYKEVEVVGAMRASNIVVLDAAEVPRKKYRPRVGLNLAIAMLVGLFSGVGLAVSQEYFDDTIKTPDDVENAARLPTLAAVPVFTAPEDLDAVPDYAPDRQVALMPTSPGAEAIRTLRASLLLASSGGLPKRILMTSSTPSEGKTCITTNLALAFAQMGKKVIAVDCDLRKPRLHAATGLANTAGVSNVLTDNATLDEVIRPSGFPNLDVITAGPIAPNPVELLGSEALDGFLKELDERYDLVLLDAPPTLGFADVPTLANRAGGACLLVAHAGVVHRHVLKHAVEYLLRMQSRVLGVVLNKVSTRGSSYSYYGGYYGTEYGIGYGGVTPEKGGKLLEGESKA